MNEPAHPLLAGWESFYVIVGSSAAALTGLQFVVITLIAQIERRGSENELAAFGTPTVVHFCLALLVSATLSAPWRDLGSAALALGAIGLGGLLYAAIVIRRARRSRGYQPVFEDWLWHTILPVVAYGALVASAIALSAAHPGAMFLVGAVTLLLVYIGIHNAWDTVTWLAVSRAPRETEAAQQSRPVEHAATGSDAQ
jgi:hypothetical protein